MNFDEEALFNFLPDTVSDPEQEAALAALDQLTPEQRAIIVLRYYYGWTDAEIAQEFARPRGTVRRWLHDAREHLRELLAPWHPFGADLRFDPNCAHEDDRSYMLIGGPGVRVEDLIHMAESIP